MTAAEFDTETRRFLAAITARVNMSGTGVCAASFDAASPFLHWLNYLSTSEKTGCCDEFLDGAKASIIETTGCLVAGLVRSAIAALRAQIDITLSWLYFKDHPVEWRRVHDFGEGFMLKADVFSYLEDYFPKFKSRYANLLAVKTRSQADPYKLLSAHVHSQSTFVMPSHIDLANLIKSEEQCKEGVLLQNEITEYISDILLAYHADKWASLPPSIVKSAADRLGPAKKGKFFG